MLSWYNGLLVFSLCHFDLVGVSVNAGIILDFEGPFCDTLALVVKETMRVSIPCKSAYVQSNQVKNTIGKK